MNAWKRWLGAVVAGGMALGTASAPALGDPSTNAAPAGLRAWHSNNGTSVDAEFVKLQYGTVQLRAAGGQKIAIGLGELIPEDQAAAKELAAASAQKPGVAQRKQPSWKAAAAAEAAKPPPAKELVDLFGDKLTNARKKNLDATELSGAEKIGIYFSAHWCPPCRAFTPKLVEVYDDLAKSGKPFQVVFVSADKDEDGMFTYMKELDMPWVAIPYDSKVRGDLMRHYQVSGIPRLVIINAKGKLLSENAVGEVGAKGAEAYGGW